MSCARGEKAHAAVVGAFVDVSGTPVVAAIGAAGDAVVGFVVVAAVARDLLLTDAAVIEFRLVWEDWRLPC